VRLPWLEALIGPAALGALALARPSVIAWTVLAIAAALTASWSFHRTR
jgi:hypothetical protein